MFQEKEKERQYSTTTGMSFPGEDQMHRSASLSTLNGLQHHGREARPCSVNCGGDCVQRTAASLLLWTWKRLRGLHSTLLLGPSGQREECKYHRKERLRLQHPRSRSRRPPTAYAPGKSDIKWLFSGWRNEWGGRSRRGLGPENQIDGDGRCISFSVAFLRVCALFQDSYGEW